MAKGKKQEVIEEEIVSPEIERQAEIELEKEKQANDEISDSLASIIEKFKSEGGSIDVKLKKNGEPTAKKIGRYKPTEFDMDLIAKQYGGGTYFYTARNDKGQILTRFQEEYAEPEKKDTIQNPQNDIVNQIANIMKDTMKEIASIKAEINKPKDDTEKDNLIIKLMSDNQKNQIDLLKAIATGNSNKNQPTITEMMTLFTGMFGIISKMNNNNQQVQQPQNSMKDVVELASLFAEMQNNGNNQPETFMDFLKSFMTDGSLANLISMIKEKKEPIIKAPQEQKQIEQPISQEEKDKQTVCLFFKQYEKELFQMKVDGNNANDISGMIISAISMNNEFKAIAYRFFKDIETAFANIYENSIEFKNEKEFLKEIVSNIHKYFYAEEETQIEQPEKQQEEQAQILPQGETVNEE